MRLVPIVLAITACCLIAAGCGASGPGRVARADLVGKTFVSTHVSGHDLVRGNRVSIAFGTAQWGANELDVSASCNDTSGTWTLAHDRLTQHDGMSTLMACAANHGDVETQEDWIDGLLASSVHVTLRGRALTIAGSGATIQLVQYDGPTTADRYNALVGVRWGLNGVGGKDALLRTPIGSARPTLRFGADHTVAIFTGCGHGRATLKLSGEALVFGPVTLTKPACSPSRRRMQRTVLRALTGRVAFAGVPGGLELSASRPASPLIYGRVAVPRRLGRPIDMPVSRDALVGRSFASTGVMGHAPLVAHRRITLAFDPPGGDDQLVVNAGCNDVSGRWSLAGRELRQHLQETTIVRCSVAGKGNVTHEENWLASLLQHGAKVRLTADRLTLTRGAVQVGFSEVGRRQRRELPKPTVAGRRWLLRRTIDAAGIRTRLDQDPDPPTMDLKDNHTTVIETGCNRIHGAARVVDTKIHFGHLTGTRRACAADAAALERSVVRVLGGAADFTLDHNVLYVARHGESLVFRAG